MYRKGKGIYKNGRDRIRPKKKKKRFLIPEILKIRQAARDFFFFFLIFFFKVFMSGCRYIIEDLCKNGLFIQSQQKHFIEK